MILELGSQTHSDNPFQEPSVSENIRAEASLYIQQIQPVMIRFLADDYDDTCSTVFPLLQVILSSVSLLTKRADIDLILFAV